MIKTYAGSRKLATLHSPGFPTRFRLNRHCSHSNSTFVARNTIYNRPRFFGLLRLGLVELKYKIIHQRICSLFSLLAQLLWLLCWSNIVKHRFEVCTKLFLAASPTRTFSHVFEVLTGIDRRGRGSCRQRQCIGKGCHIDGRL